MTDTIRLASSGADFDSMAVLVAGYVAWCRERYRDLPWFVDRVFGHQALGVELAALASSYAAPRGRALLASRGDETIGIVAYRTLGDGVCEMKRLYVSTRVKSAGSGRRLCEAIIAAARDDGHRLMRLDTGDRMTEATALYESLGFRRCPAYHDYPAELRPHIAFMELPLQG